jgi:hypothetical protein
MKQNLLKLFKVYSATYSMSNINATEGNVESPSTYGQEGYRAYRKQEKKKQEERNYKSNVQT